MLATLLRLLGSFDAAEEELHDAFAAAAEQWPRDGVPRNPYAWLVSAGRFKTISRWRQNARLARALPELLAQSETSSEPFGYARVSTRRRVAEALGLLALMLLHEARRTARVDAAGDLVLLGDQDRELWDSELICEAQSLIERALKTRRIDPYVLQARLLVHRCQRNQVTR